MPASSHTEGSVWLDGGTSVLEPVCSRASDRTSGNRAEVRMCGVVEHDAGGQQKDDTDPARGRWIIVLAQEPIQSTGE